MCRRKCVLLLVQLLGVFRYKLRLTRNIVCHIFIINTLSLWVIKCWICLNCIFRVWLVLESNIGCIRVVSLSIWIVQRGIGPWSINVARILGNISIWASTLISTSLMISSLKLFNRSKGWLERWCVSSWWLRNSCEVAKSSFFG